MKLSEIQRNTLHAAEFHADLPAKKIAHRCKSREHVVRYQLQRMRDAGIVSQSRPFIDLNATGYTSYVLYFSLASENLKDKEQTLQKLQKSSQVLWILEIGGDYQYAILICARHVSEVKKLLAQISKKFGRVMFEKSLSVRIGYTAFQRRYLATTSKDKKREFLSYNSFSKLVGLSDGELKILSGLANESYRNDKELAERLEIPLTSFLRKKRGLEEKKIILGYYYRAHADRFGMQLYKLLIHARGMSEDLSNELLKYSQNLKSSTYFIECMGKWDFEIGLELSRAADVTLVTSDLYDRFGVEISLIQVMPVFRFQKLTSFPASTTSLS